MAERCRYCGRTLKRKEPEHARHWPFCSERCKWAELGRWLDGRYVISRPVDQVADDAALAPPRPHAKRPRKPDRGNNS